MTMQRPTYGTDSANQNANQGATIVGQTAPNISGPGPAIMAADTLENNKVIGPAGEDLGNIEHIMLDVGSGRIAYAVLSFGGFLGIGEKLFAVPWSALTLDTRHKCFVLGIEKSRLKDAPGFDKDHWPTMADARWATSIHDYYQASPYWSSTAAGRVVSDHH
jgi:sporulation protein YlmC with PRC-barrel domain